MYVFLAAILGITIGGSVGVWWTRSTQPASIFGEGSREAQELRIEAHKVVHARIEKRKARIVAVVQKEGRITNDGVEDLFCIGG